MIKERGSRQRIMSIWVRKALSQSGVQGRPAIFKSSWNPLSNKAHSPRFAAPLLPQITTFIPWNACDWTSPLNSGVSLLQPGAHL